MIRSLWTAATGMNAQQINVDTIANNIANVNTTGYKTEQNQFKSLLYQTLQTKTTTANGERKPSTAQTGLGVRNAAITSIFTNGALLDSESETSFGIEGRGFFAVKGYDGQTYYTRNGEFGWSIETNGAWSLCNSDGEHVLDTRGRNITLPNNTDPQKVTVSQDGTLMYPNAQNVPTSMNMKIGLYQFNNPAGLQKIGSTQWAVTAASGQPINEEGNNVVEKSRILQGYLEGANVDVANEMVNLIIAQRAYEMNSKAITTSDEMLQQANELKR